MKAYFVDSSATGGIRLADAPEPQPRANEALIAVEAVSLNRGEIPSHGLFPQGTIPGWDSAGRVVTAAADGSGPPAGTPVVGFGWGGAWAERRAVATSSLAALPAGCDADAASTLPVAGGTALRALRTLGAILGRRVLVTGATGGVGRLAVQLGRLAGARVVALTSSSAKRDELIAIGAHEVVTEIAQLSAPVDGAIETIGGQALVDAWSHLRTDGTLVSVGYAGGAPATFPPSSTIGPRKTLISFTVTTPTSLSDSLAEDFGYLAELVAAGSLDPQIVWRGPWTKLLEAIDQLETRKIAGKAVLRVGVASTEAVHSTRSASGTATSNAASTVPIVAYTPAPVTSSIVPSRPNRPIARSCAGVESAWVVRSSVVTS